MRANAGIMGALFNELASRVHPDRLPSRAAAEKTLGDAESRAPRPSPVATFLSRSLAAFASQAGGSWTKLIIGFSCRIRVLTLKFELSTVALTPFSH